MLVLVLLCFCARVVEEEWRVSRVDGGGGGTGGGTCCIGSLRCGGLARWAGAGVGVQGGAGR